MKNLAIIALLLGSAFALYYTGGVAGSLRLFLLKPSNCEVTSEMFADYPNNKLLVDVRSFEEFNVSHIKDAISIHQLTEMQIESLPSDTTVLLYCSAGIRSSKAISDWNKMGFGDVCHISDGCFGWINHGLPLYDKNEMLTDQIHGYNRFWATMLKKGEVVYVR